MKVCWVYVIYTRKKLLWIQKTRTDPVSQNWHLPGSHLQLAFGGPRENERHAEIRANMEINLCLIITKTIFYTINISYVKGGLPPLAEIISLGDHKVWDSPSNHEMFTFLHSSAKRIAIMSTFLFYWLPNTNYTFHSIVPCLPYRFAIPLETNLINSIFTMDMAKYGQRTASENV